MASKALATSLLLTLNLAFFAMVCSSALSIPFVPMASPPPPFTAPPPSARCPMDVLKLGACVNVLNLVNVTIGSQQASPCCSLLGGLVDLEAAVCLCTALRANILGINLNLPISHSLILNGCGRNNSSFQCN